MRAASVVSAFRRTFVEPLVVSAFRTFVEPLVVSAFRRTFVEPFVVSAFRRTFVGEAEERGLPGVRHAYRQA